MARRDGGARTARKGTTARVGGTALALLASTALGTLSVPLTGGPVQAQEAVAEIDYAVPEGPLGRAISRFGDASGLQVLYPAALVRGKTSPGVAGSMTPEAALRRLLAGSGLTYRFTGATTVTIVQASSDRDAGEDGRLTLEPITVTAGGDGAPSDAPYRTAAPTAYIGRETIERFRGSNPADIFRGTPGVMSGDARNSGSAVDVNIRGMQGMGRVNVTIDGAMNATTVYQGYQGVSNRTFVDPDFVAEVDITKGSDATSRGIAGSVAMRTLEARDIVKPGNIMGLRVKGEVGTNSRYPKPGHQAGYDIPGNVYLSNPNPPVPTASPEGMGRSEIKPASGSGSFVAAYQDDRVEVLAGYSHRKRGNYFAGKNGPTANIIDNGPQPFCYPSGFCYPVGHPISLAHDYQNAGLANYRGGEEVLNTQLETESFLGKGTVKFGDGHALQLGYMYFMSESGDILASRFNTAASQATQQAQTVGSELNTFTLKHHWQPRDSSLIDLRANLWHTTLERRNPRRAGTQWTRPQPEDLGLPADYRVGTDNTTWGGDVSNESSVRTGIGLLSLSYGGSYLEEETQPSPFTLELEDWLKVRDGERQEAAGFVKGGWTPLDWLTVNGGLRYMHYWTQDRSEPDPSDTTGEMRGQGQSGGGVSPSLGVTVEPVKDVQLYVNYSSAVRAPSIMEALTGFSTRFNPDLEPERSNNWEIGANVIRRNLIEAQDQGMIKLGYFDWTVHDYLARQWKTDLVSPSGSTYSSMYVYNIDKAKFSGLELSGRYSVGGFAAELSANYYTNVEFCPTSDTCGNNSLYADYATNQVPPRYTADLTLTQALFDDTLTIGGRGSRIGSRAISHGEETARGMSSFISLVDWKPYWLFDAFAEYKLTDNLTATFRAENLTDQYYVDPLSLVMQPGPGRTLYAGFTAEF